MLRGTGEELIFKDQDDYYRGIFSIFEFNTTKPVEIAIQRRKRKIQKNKGEQFSDDRDLLVEILAFCFMPNHIHLLLYQKKDGGITNFMRKFGAGYASYFNKRHKRKGHLFQGRFRAVHIQDESQLRTVFVYIHCNPLSLIEPSWKEKGIKQTIKSTEFLENFKWSSYQDYIGKNNFPSVTQKDFLVNAILGKGGGRNLVRNWIRYKKDLVDWYEVGIE
ncbi:MAG: transposase [Patescibacteria group bacterium]